MNETGTGALAVLNGEKFKGMVEQQIVVAHIVLDTYERAQQQDSADRNSRDSPTA